MYPEFPDNPLASAVFDAHPPEFDLTTWSVEHLRELAVWNTAVLSENVAVEDVLGLVDDPPVPDFPEHNVTSEEELDQLDVA